MSSTERRDREREALRRTILDATRELFAAEDYEKVSMRRIADKIDYSPTAIYLHFKDKGELMDALAAEGFALLATSLAAAGGNDPVERLRRLAGAYVEFALTHRPYYRLMFQFGESRQEVYGDYSARLVWTTQALDTLYAVVREVAGAPETEDGDAVQIAARVLWAHLHGAVSLILVGALGAYKNAPMIFCNKAVETAIAGLLAELKSPALRGNEEDA